LWIFRDFQMQCLLLGDFAWIFHDFPLTLSNWIDYKILSAFGSSVISLGRSMKIHDTSYDKTKGSPKHDKIDSIYFHLFQ
jgi:hypothetical protein